MQNSRTTDKQKVRLSIDCSPEERRHIKTQAKKFRKSITEYILDLTGASVICSSKKRKKLPYQIDLWETQAF